MQLIPIVQIGALTGLWGITFLVMLFSPLVVVSLTSRKRALLTLLAVFGCAFGFGAWRMWATPPAPSVRVALVETGTPANVFPTRDADVMQLMRDYAGQVQLLARQGAKIVVLRARTEHRSSKRGLLTVSDDRGRVLASASTRPTRTFTSLVATVPMRHEATLYQRWGDWFAWVDLAGLSALLALPAGHNRGTSIGVRRLYAT